MTIHETSAETRKKTGAPIIQRPLDLIVSSQKQSCSYQTHLYPYSLAMSLKQPMQFPMSSSSPYIVDHIRTMRQQEMTSYKLTKDYLQQDSNDSTTSIKITAADRETMLTWAYGTVDGCNLDRHVAITAIAYLDRFLSNSSCRRAKSALSSHHEYQLCFIACLVTSIKTRAGRNVGSKFISTHLCHELYTKEEVAQAEIEILYGLEWKLNGPTAIDFVHAFLDLMPLQLEEEASELLVEAAEAQIETALLNYAFTHQEPSSIAYSSILNAMQCLGYSSIHLIMWVQSISFYAGLDAADPKNDIIRHRLIEIAPIDQAFPCASPNTLEVHSKQMPPAA
jgi:hypothetical protein